MVSEFKKEIPLAAKSIIEREEPNFPASATSIWGRMWRKRKFWEYF
jgi:hypothetical protein